MEKILIVDGHSVIHASKWLLEIHENHQESGREALVRELSNFQNTSLYNVVLVFDGKGKMRTKRGGSDKEILILYSLDSESADQVIERIVAKQARRHQVEVVSNDRMVLDSSSASGAFAMSVKSLWDLLDSY